MYYGGFPPYVPVAERKRQAAQKVSELKRRGRVVSPVRVAGRQIASTFWGQAWCSHLEGLGDYASRLPRGRTYVRNGSVIDLQIGPRRIDALVSGSEIYTVAIDVHPLATPRWRALTRECTGQIGSVVELLSGKLSQGVMGILCRPDAGLFPTGQEISLDCSCPDGAWLCKHLAAVLYGVGSRLDSQPELLFLLRGVDQTELVIAASGGAKLGKKPAQARTLDDASVAGIFGIELDEEAPSKSKEKAKQRKPKPGAKVISLGSRRKGAR